MKVKLNIVCGMIGSGKTKFINKLIKNSVLINEIVCIVQLENGKSKISENSSNINVIKVDKIDKIYIDSIIAKYNPDRIIIEMNSMKNNNEIIDCLYNINYLDIDKILCIIDSKTFKLYYDNMRFIIAKGIQCSNIVYLNNIDKVSKSDVKYIRKKIKELNQSVKIYSNEATEKIFDGNMFFYVLFTSLILSITYLILYGLNMIDIVKYVVNSEILYNISLKFLGILLETIPFIIIGATISGIIQIYITNRSIAKIFPKNNFLSCVVASLVGFLFPVCDCGTIPVARGLLKGGVSKSAALTFMFAAPIVNPIAMLSTFVAFSDNKMIVLYRVIIGITVAIIIGVTTGNLKGNEFMNTSQFCDCIACNMDSQKITNRFKSLITYISDEFFILSKYLIIGAFLSSCVQSILSYGSFAMHKDNILGVFVFIIFASLVFSICSTSDSFIAKNFESILPSSGIVGFMVLGPIINIKNLIILNGSFKIGFIIKIITIAIISTLIMITVMPI